MNMFQKKQNTSDQGAAHRPLASLPEKFILPVILTVVLFIMTIFLLILPLLEERMMAGKRETIRELTETAWSALDFYAQREAGGAMTRAAAQGLAKQHIRSLRYGPERKDYFWINDMQPRLIIHPYRADLEGEDISDYADPNGKHLFVECVNIVRKQGAGYVDYEWQWKDDPNRTVPKISFVKGFAPWGWVIGTGIYVEDVREEIAAITRRVTLMCVGILAVIIALSAYIIWQGAGVEKERKHTEEALKKSEEKYRLLAETAGEMILSLDLEGRLTYVNKEGLETLEYPPGDILDMNIIDILAPEEHEDFNRRLERRLAGETAHFIYESVFVSKSGTRIPVEATSSLLQDRDEPAGVLITARDVTEKKVAEEQSRLHQEQLFQAAKMASLGTLISGVAHEINNPLTSVMLNIPILQKAWDSLLPILEDHCRENGDFYVGGMNFSQLGGRMPMLLADISEGVKRVRNIVSELKDFARQRPPEMNDDVDLNQVVKKGVALVFNLIKKSTRHFSAEYGPGLQTFKGNAQRIEQVVINLLVNACQALQDNDQAVSIVTGYDAAAGRITLEIQDQGVGMPEDILQRIRDPFFTTKRDDGGTGLGLAISDRIIQEHGGTMNFVTAPGKGTLVRLELPDPAEHQTAEDTA